MASLVCTLTIVGSLASAFGLPIAIWQIVKTKSAVHASEIATNDLRKRLSDDAVIRDLEKVKGASRTAVRELELEQWREVARILEMKRQTLIKLSVRLESRDLKRINEVPEICSQISQYSRYLTTSRREKMASSKLDEIRSNMNDLAELYAHWEVTIKEQNA